ncbi:RNA polymerase sigma factor [Kineosporia corallincola]|uniref:RNA polymerase sigma factor n=1 Tax=Kineosporia corallincola TaxID=2835133 RepID=UPI0035580A85
MRHPDDAADLVADTFLVAWRRRTEVPPGGDARLWLFPQPPAGRCPQGWPGWCWPTTTAASSAGCGWASGCGASTGSTRSPPTRPTS